jgi:ribosomal protein L11 methyltransferase
MDFSVLGIEVESDEDEADHVLRAFLPASGTGHELRSALLAAGAASVEDVPVPEVDWVDSFRETFRAFATGAFFLCPAWDPSAAEARRQLRGLVVEPGAAFGTGTHETTQLCLAALDSILASRPAARVLDLGTGSGILACAAAKLGARAVVAVDSDPVASVCAKRHADLNGVRLDVLCGDLCRPLSARFEVVVANLQTSLLVERSREIAAAAAPGGHLLLSGCLVSDLDALLSHYAPSGSIAVRTEGEWALLEVRIP